MFVKVDRKKWNEKYKKVRPYKVASVFYYDKEHNILMKKTIFWYKILIVLFVPFIFFIQAIKQGIQDCWYFLKSELYPYESIITTDCRNSQFYFKLKELGYTKD